MKPNGFVRGGRDDLPDVDPHAVAHDRHLVDERDVDRAEDVLEQLGELGRVGRRHRHQLVAAGPVDGHRLLGAGRRDAADDLRRVADREVGAAGVDALRRHREVEVVAARRARTVSRIGRSRPLVVPGYVVDSSTTTWPRCRRAATLSAAELDERGVRLAVLRQRRRHADDHGADVAHGVVVGGRRRAARRAPAARARRRSRRRRTSSPAMICATLAGSGSTHTTRVPGRRRTGRPAAGRRTPPLSPPHPTPRGTL